MSVHHKDDCPCGSGKRYKHCHLASDEARRKKTTVAVSAVVGLLVVGVAAFGAMNQWKASHPSTPAATLPDSGAVAARVAGGDVSGVPAPATPGAFGIVQPGATGRPPIPQTTGTSIPVRSSSAALAPGENPTPWEYDVQRNRHYDPREGHQHWHNGPPPADTTQAVVVAPRQIKLDASGNVISESASRVAGTAATTGSSPLLPGQNPKPYEYDKAKNQYYDPDHKHWHSGPPPAGK